jgi:hypothetical protein
MVSSTMPETPNMELYFHACLNNVDLVLQKWEKILIKWQSIKICPTKSELIQPTLSCVLWYRVIDRSDVLALGGICSLYFEMHIWYMHFKISKIKNHVYIFICYVCRESFLFSWKIDLLFRLCKKDKNMWIH